MYFCKRILTVKKMLHKKFVSFDIAKKLKENGFRDKCIATYDKFGTFSFNYEVSNEEVDVTNLEYSHNSYDSGIWIDAPMISQVLDWLRKKGLSVEVSYLFTELDLWTFEIKHMGSCFTSYDDKEYTSHVDAENAAIEFALDNIVSKQNENENGQGD